MRSTALEFAGCASASAYVSSTGSCFRRWSAARQPLAVLGRPSSPLLTAAVLLRYVKMIALNRTVASHTWGLRTSDRDSCTRVRNTARIGSPCLNCLQMFAIGSQIYGRLCSFAYSDAACARDVCGTGFGALSSQARTCHIVLPSPMPLTTQMSTALGPMICLLGSRF